MKLSPDRKAGLYITVSIHLAVIVVLLAVRIGFEVQRENSFVLDFSAQEQVEKLQEQLRLQESVQAQLERMLAQREDGVPLRNIAVDRGALKDDRGTDAEKLYREAERLARELQQGQQPKSPEESFAAVEEARKEQPRQEQKATYNGPSVLSWSLDGRNASHLPIPAYRCYGGGEVTVVIAVNNRGDVVNAKVDESLSSADGCLRDFAVRAARLSRFSASAQAPARQMGTITYAFVAQ